jgi:hypothetical protein
VFGGPISDPGKIRKYSSVKNRSRCGLWPQGEKTPHQHCWSLRIGSGGKVSPHDHRIWKMCVEIKIPFELHRSVGIAIRELPKTRKLERIYVVDLGKRLDR